ncbi:MAG: hydrogenase formation protein HypD [Omnitrophica WOR_2 bacterium RBG_13_44_8b]|nr:MAG: hydrogenase formation protein HypD [Omnitrophica WOR_2 bacterium RBG_13_44_8b]
MKYVDEFRNAGLIKKVLNRLKEISPKRTLNLMEVCGTHTQNFCRFGLDKLLPDSINLIAGPGCPVCVSPQEYIDTAIKLCQDRQNIILTFGDMLRIPGSRSTLEKQRAEHGNVRVVYSSLESINVARQHPDKRVIFLAVGFETTAPTIALSILAAKKQNIKNLFFYSSLKLIPPAMKYLVCDRRLNLSGFLCPGHVSAIIGTRPYEFIPQKYRVGCCVTGFEPLDILEGIYLLVFQIVNKKPKVENQYARVVTRRGNIKAQNIMQEVFRIQDASWRGLGTIAKSGLGIRNEFSGLDAEKKFSIAGKIRITSSLSKKCRCADILKGLILPPDCPLFSRICSPDNPIGPCMVSSEGACNAYYRYK